MPDDLRHRYAEALANAECEKRPRCVNCMADAVMVVRDEAMGRLEKELGRVAALAAIQEYQMDKLREERDLAIAHDRQPYPTAWAYEQACKALNKWRERAEQAETKVLAYESADCYVTSCTSCAGHLDRERRQEERAEKAEAAVARVRAAHPMVDDGYGPECRGCGNPAAGIVSWPCPTIAALDSQSPNVEPERPAQEATDG